MVEAWLDDVLDEGADSVMLAATRTEVDELNQLARVRLHAEGALDEPELQAGGRTFAVGDWVMTTRNDYRLGVLNGRRGHVTDIDASGRWLTAIVGDNSHPVVLGADRLDDGFLDHAYAMTIHKASPAMSPTSSAKRTSTEKRLTPR